MRYAVKNKGKIVNAYSVNGCYGFVNARELICILADTVRSGCKSKKSALLCRAVKTVCRHRIESLENLKCTHKFFLLFLGTFRPLFSCVYMITVFFGIYNGNISEFIGLLLKLLAKKRGKNGIFPFFPFFVNFSFFF